MSATMRSARLVRHTTALRPALTARSRASALGPAWLAAANSLLYNGRGIPSQVSALAILLPQRGYATEHNTSTSSQSYPPPGFNAEQAKKPLPQDQAQNVKPATSSQSDVAKVPARDATSKAGAVEGGKNLAEEKKEAKKLTIGQKIKKEVQHYWDGTKLLATEVKISSRLALKMAGGYELSRREHRQLQRTVKDLGRLVPFSMFVIVPFAELLLPIALKLFPNLLPSTYEGQRGRETKALKLSSTRKEVSTFLRNTLRETGLPLTAATVKNEEFADFFRKIRTTGESPSTEDVIKVCKIFKDDLTLDNLSRPQLVAICRYMNLNSFGTDAMLRYNIRHRMRQIKRDDRAISYEGVNSLSVPELQMAAASRGIRTHGVSPARLREDLSMWLDLRLKQGVPSTLLVLSNAYMYTQGGKESEMASQIDALKSVLSSIPEELFHEIELEVHNAEGAATNKQRLEVLKEQEELIEEENSENEGKGVTAPKDIEDIDEKEEHKSEAAADGTKEQSSEATEAMAEGAKAGETPAAKEEKKTGQSS
ncbi:LETM1 domain-containing protein mdm28 [Penicillium canariense]|uniref:LETM1 domain-containing protein mdm28 n=1 Tax=Penicillium canariense TaxID=189055 RepID=A0A9W9LFC6_9EURO|nr:LETM1 domain-containing protein mdm28 [Penicillium canariense]KAJ5153381.1 LETM1 domain-containing protein mdm28 [Penicillium canariense]